LLTEQVQLIRGRIHAARAGTVGLSGDMLQALSLAHQALESLPEAEAFYRLGALGIAIRAYLVSGDASLATEQAVAAAPACWRGCTSCRAGSSRRQNGTSCRAWRWSRRH
jgi:hypothetical protein